MTNTHINEQVLAARLAELEKAQPWSPGAVAQLGERIHTADAQRLMRINPIRYAKESNLSEIETINLFLFAVKVGLFEMEWQLVCPGCGGTVESMHSLAAMHQHFRCGMCDVDRTSSLDDTIHVSFSVSPLIVPFAQNDSPAAPEMLVEGEYLAAKRLLNIQTFRDLFRNETIPADEEIGVRDITVMFTDLKGSTEMYDRVGDPQAFYLVRQHFDTLGKVVARYEGATIKTIGDSVMATFMNPRDGVNAALEMLRGIAEFNRTISEKLILKIGLHRGQSILVNLNDRLDYFGQTINIASRVQGLAGPGEIYITDPVYQFAGVKDLLDGKTSVTAKQAALRGVSEQVQVYKVEAAA